MNILIIEQVRLVDTHYQLFEKMLLTSFSILPTLYARHLAAITPKNHMVKILNERYEPIRISEEYDLVIIHFSSAASSRAYEIADKFRQKKVIVVLSGLHASALPKEALEHADSVLLGRGEGNYLQLLNDVEKDTLKSLYDPCKYQSYDIPLTRVELPGFMMTGAVEATRGCPYHCSFCPDANTPNGRVFYPRPVEEVIEEIKMIPQKTIMFYDASLTIDPTYTKELFSQMKSLHKRFFCSGNVNVLAQDEELVALSREAGCISWLIGFESISQKTLDDVGKVTNTVETYKTVVDSIHAHHMAVIGDFMFGFDTDTPEVFDETLKLINNLGIDVADFSILTPFPGTPLFESFKKQGRILTSDWRNYTMHSVVFKPQQMSTTQLMQGNQYLYASFYNPIETLKRITKSLKLGLYPFFMVISRNLISMIASQKISIISKENEGD
ncbi:B12-binding domain-containing radical SAM protein [Pseudomonadota bacterium]